MATRAASSPAPDALRATLECGQMALLRRFLKIAQHCEDIGTLRRPQQSPVHVAVGDLGGDARFAGCLQAGVALDLSRPRGLGYRQPEPRIRRVKRPDV